MERRWLAVEAMFVWSNEQAKQTIFDINWDESIGGNKFIHQHSQDVYFLLIMNAVLWPYEWDHLSGETLFTLSATKALLTGTLHQEHHSASGSAVTQAIVCYHLSFKAIHYAQMDVMAIKGHYLPCLFLEWFTIGQSIPISLGIDWSSMQAQDNKGTGKWERSIAALTSLGTEGDLMLPWHFGEQKRVLPLSDANL